MVFDEPYAMVRHPMFSTRAPRVMVTLLLAGLSLAACSSTRETESTMETTPSFEAPRVTAPGTSSISPSIQSRFCQDQVAFVYDAQSQNVRAGAPVVAADGGTTIDVTVDRGNGSVNTFKCRLDATNRFIDVVATTNDPSL